MTDHGIYNITTQAAATENFIAGELLGWNVGGFVEQIQDGTRFAGFVHDAIDRTARAQVDYTHTTTDEVITVANGHKEMTAAVATVVSGQPAYWLDGAASPLPTFNNVHVNGRFVGYVIGPKLSDPTGTVWIVDTNPGLQFGLHDAANQP